jgi:23S rRNA G2069 N7-methylase RlmK/C1962 C5-methylase RlmI
MERTGLIFEDDNWLVVDKPPGVSTHGAFPGDMAMQEWLGLHWDVETFVCSRLDKGTSGVLMFARNAAASGEAQRVHERDESEKEYLFLSSIDSFARGHEAQWRCDAELDGLAAFTRFKRLRQVGRHVLYSATISRGRTHQIRRHAQRCGIPILGDAEYGGSVAPRLFLHCHMVRWPGMEKPWVSDVPASFVDTEWQERAFDFPVALERRGALLSSVTDAWRLVHRGELAAADISVDLYGRHLCVWIYEEHRSLAESEERLAPMLREMARRTGAVGWVCKRTRRNPHTNRFVDEELVSGEHPPPVFQVREHNLRFNVSLVAQQHVGLFLDQRDSRRLVFKGAMGRRAANLFSYTCSFSVAALAGGAEVVFSVDLSKKFLQQGQENVALNGLVEGARGKFIAEDVRKWLDRQVRKVEREGEGAKLALVVCDPPTFSTSGSRGEFRVDETWESLARSLASIMTRDGMVFFSNNHQKGDSRAYQRVLERFFPVVERRVPPLDFPDVSERGEHVRLYRVGHCVPVPQPV